MSDPQAGIDEMARVTRREGLVSACVWDHAGGLGPRSVFWRAVRDLDPGAWDESALPGTGEGQLVELFNRARLHNAAQTTLTVSATFADPAAWWHPCTLGVGPAGAYVATLERDHRESLRTRCSDLLPTGPFTVSATAWAATARA